MSDTDFQDMIAQSYTVAEITAFIANKLAEAGFRVVVDMVTIGKTPKVTVNKMRISVDDDQILVGTKKFPMHDPDCFDKLIEFVKAKGKISSI